MKIKNKKIFCIFLVLSLHLFPILLINFKIGINADNIQTNHKNSQAYQNSIISKPSYSTHIDRPNGDISNTGFERSPIYCKIDDSITSPSSGGDPVVNIISPIEGESMDDTCVIAWDYSDPDEDIGNFSLYYNIDGGSWIPIVSGLENESYYIWDLSGFSQRETNVNLRIIASDGYTNTSDEIGPITIKNHFPAVYITSPNEGESFEDSCLITWDYSDLDGDFGNFSLYFFIDGGYYYPIVLGLFNQTSYLWDLSTWEFSIFTQNATIVNISIMADDGYNKDFDEVGPLTIINHSPVVYITSLLGEEHIFDDTLLINWDYSDPDGDLGNFSLFYNIEEGPWITIVSGLFNQTSYLWDLSEFTQEEVNVSVRIQVDDGNGRLASHTSFSFTIHHPHSLNINPLLTFWIIMIISSSVAMSSLYFSIKIMKNKKKNMTESDIEETSENEIIPHQKNKAKIIIEGEMLLKKQDGISKSASVLSLLANNMNLLNEIDGKGGYEVFKVLGQFNVTSLSDEFCEKIEKLDWKDNEKADFISDMLSLTPEERNELIDGMISKFGTKTQAPEISEN